MTIAKDGRAIICGELVPRAEVAVLHALVKLGNWVTISELSQSEFLSGYSYGSIYSLLRRLREKRNLAKRKDETIAFFGTVNRRVLWRATKDARDFFEEQ